MTENKKVMAKNIVRYMEEKGVNATEICKVLDIKQSNPCDKCHLRPHNYGQKWRFYAVSDTVK